MNRLPDFSARRFVIALSLTTALAGCAVGPDYERPSVALPGDFAPGTENAAEASLPQAPEYAPIQFAGHEAGEFFFQPKG